MIEIESLAVIILLVVFGLCIIGSICTVLEFIYASKDEDK
jgi:hypothetical protein